MFNIIVIGIASTAVDELLICPERSLWLNVRGAVEQVVVIGAIPVTIISLLLRNNMLKGNLQNALRANEELQRIKSLKKEIRENAVVDSKITLRSETTETLSISLPELLFIQADSNYSTVYWKESENINKKLLRVNLKNLETQINNAYAMRCHRSFIVNVSAIDTIIGNTNGYKLTIRGTDISIPVSRHKGRDIIDKIGQLKSMMELA
jgi:DNA-binding LytR/AlgR family response regulator